jgi:hypothetical protein
MAKENLMTIHKLLRYDSRVLGEYTEKIGGYLGCRSYVAVIA